MICGAVLCKQFEYEYFGTRAGEHVEGTLTVEAPDYTSVDAMAAQKLRGMGISMLVGSSEPDLDGSNHTFKCPGCNAQFTDLVITEAADMEEAGV